MAISKPRRGDLKATTLLTPLSQTSSLQNCEEIHFCCLSHEVCNTLLLYSLQTNTHNGKADSVSKGWLYLYCPSSFCRWLFVFCCFMKWCFLWLSDFNNTNMLCGASLVTKMVKNLPEMQEIWVWSLSREDLLEGGHGNPLQCSCWENSMDRGAWQLWSIGYEE